MPETEYPSKSLQMVSLPKSGGRMIASMLSGIFVGACCLAFVPWQQTVTATGKVTIYSPMNRPQNIESEIDGRIKQWHVKEGQEVKINQPILSLDETDHKFLDPDLSQSKEKEKQSLFKRLRARQVRAQAIKDQLAHTTQIKGDPALIHELRVKLAMAIEDVAATEQEVHSTETEIRALERRIRQREIKSSVAGIVVKTFKSSGEIVSKGTTLAIIAPHTEDLSAELTISGNDAPLVTKGEAVRLQFAGFPAVQLVGWPSVASGTFAGKIFAVDPIDDGKGNYRAIVLPDRDRILQNADEPWPSSKYLRAGSQVNGWIMLKIVPLGFELWRRVNAFPPSIDKPPESSIPIKKLNFLKR